MAVIKDLSPAIDKALGVSETVKKFGVGERDMLFILKKGKHFIMRPHASITKGGNVYPLRYSRIFSHPFEADQQTNRKTIPVGSVAFNDMKILASKNDPCLQLFLLMNPKNGSVYTLFDKGEKTKADLKKYSIKAKAIGLVSKTDDTKLKDIANCLFYKEKGYSPELGREEIELFFYKLVDSKPDEVIEAFDYKDVEVFSDVVMCVRAGIVKERDGVFTWGATGKPIYTTNTRGDKIRAFVRWLTSKDGEQSLQLIEQELKSTK
jgi:hypothetical protein